MTKILYARYATYVILAGLYVLNASVAQAGAWEEFETRCLTPMENVQAIKMSGLSRQPDLELIEFRGLSKFKGYTISAPDDRDFAIMQVPNVVTCIFRDYAATEATRLAARNWADAMVESGRYERFDKDEADLVYLLSTDWREPKLEVILEVSNASDLHFISAETDLES